MEDLEKKIEEAAYKACDKEATEGVTTKAEENMFYQGFMSGAKSPEAKAYWLQKLSEEFESKQGDSYMEVIEVVNKVLKSNMAKEYWQEKTYSEEDVENILIEYTKSEFAHNSQPIKFFLEYKRNKKK